ncbi:uncharacterized protein LOC132733844, partial [Ruditapes philippinarum]|uniref:uncharacterized protein LOC132733844 n=1 Tax=Ruditapes philippinarum TaxID=129788 RepID=UPI00295A88E2
MNILNLIHLFHSSINLFTGSRMDSNKQAATEVYLKLLHEATEALEESISKGYTAQNIAVVVTAKLALEGDESIKPQLERIKDMFIEVIEGKPIQEILDIPKGYEYILKTFKDLLSHIEQTTGAKATDPKKACINLQFSCETEVEKLKLLKYFASDDHKYCIADFANKISNFVGSPIGVHVSFKISDESLLSILQEGDSGRKSQKDSFKFDGRLILLDSNQIHTLETSLDENPIGQGGIGTVYRLQ